MLADAKNEAEKQWNMGLPKRYTHYVSNQKEYFQQLSEAAGIENIPNVIVDIYEDSVERGFGDLRGYREFKYTINGTTFTKVADPYKPPNSKP